MESQSIEIITEEQFRAYDLVIIGAGCVGMAMAYITSQQWINSPENAQKKICLIEKQSLEDPNRYWSSSFSARQNRIQYNEDYLVQYVRKSNQFWQEIERKAGETFYHKEGALWFGDKDATTSQGSIVESNRTLQRLNVNRLYLKNLIPGQPRFLKNFNIKDMKSQRKGHSWQALYCDEGGSINMQSSYKYFLSEIRKAPNVTIKESSTILKHTKTLGLHEFRLQSNGKNAFSFVTAIKVFIAVGIYTPQFICNIMNGGQELKEEAKIQEYVASYFKIKEGWQDQFDSKKCPNFYNFLDPLSYKYQAGYGFPFHEWDQPVKGTVKIGTLSHRNITDPYSALKEIIISVTPSLPKQDDQDKRVLDNEHYVRTFLNGLQEYSSKNYVCPMIFYEGRETILDYLNREDKSVVVQNGGWIGKYYPYLAKTAYRLLFDFSQEGKDELMKSHQQLPDQERIVKNFLSRVRFPIRKYIEKLLSNPKNKLENRKEFDTIIIGGGCSGLYSAYRLNEQKNSKDLKNNKKHKIAICEMLGRISGRLWSVSFQGSKTPMELGGMRYIENEHKLLVNMIKKLQIPSLSFNMKGDYLQSQALKAYLRGSRYSKNEWDKHHQAGQKFHTNYRMDQPLIGMNAAQIFSYSIYLILTAEHNQEARTILNSNHLDQADYFSTVVQTVPRANWTEYQVHLSLYDWNLIKNVLKYRPCALKKGAEMKLQYLYKFGFQNIIEDQFSHQAYQFVSSQNGYFSLTSNESYIEHIVGFLLDFGLVTYKTLAGGFDMLNYNMAGALLNDETGTTATGGGIYLKHQLINIQKNNQKYLLTLKDSNNQKTIQLVATNVILAMPRRSVERLYEKIYLLQRPITYPYETSTSPIQPKNLLELVNSVRSMPSIKIIMNFKTNWWDIAKRCPQFSTGQQMRGVSITDLPIRQTLYFGTDTDHMLLASYNDKNTTEFWSVLQKGFDDFQPFDQFPLVGTDESFNGKPKRCRMCHKKRQNLAPASYQVVHEVLRQLRLLHGQMEGIDETNVKEVMFQNWEQDPFGGGYHFWKPGYNVKEVMETIRKPWNNQNYKENIFVISSAYSNTTAWAEGALQMSERLLVDHFGLQQYLPEYYKGW